MCKSTCVILSMSDRQENKLTDFSLSHLYISQGNLVIFNEVRSPNVRIFSMPVS